MAEANNGSFRRNSSQRGAGGPPGMQEAHRLSRTGDSLYELLEIPKNSTQTDIKKRYRRLALKYHPDKNPDNPEAEEMFKKINHANSVLQDEKKKAIYDKYGSFGLYIADQFGDETVGTVMMMSSKWFQCVFWTCFCLSGCCFCCCLFCCCNCCCGKCKPKVEEDGEFPDVAEFEGADEEDDSPTVVTDQPGANSSDKPPPYQESVAGKGPIAMPPPSNAAIPMPPPGGAAVIAMPPPDEKTALNMAGETKSYSHGMSDSSKVAPS